MVELSSLNVIGCGRLGQAIAKLLVTHGVTKHVYVCNRSRVSGERAVTVIGRGTACESVPEMPPSDLWLLSCGDQEIGTVAQCLAESGTLSPRSVVFHCSGILSSEVLAPLRARGALVGSVHPVRSFADADLAVREFAGTYCAIEGDLEAVRVLETLFTKVGGRAFTISSDAKMLCHAGHVFASNYLVALLECSRRLYAAAGVPEDLAVQIMQPLVHGTLQNVSRLGHAQALTGPIARGESGVVAEQLSRVAGSDPLLGDLYQSLGRIAVELARAQGLSPEKCAQVEAAFAEPR